MIDELGQRIKTYEDAYDTTIIKRLPVICRIDGKNFSRLTKKIQRPFDLIMIELMAQTMVSTIMEMEGAVFGYQQSDEITFILKNDQSFESEPWFGNRIFKIASITSSIATLSFKKHFDALDKKIDLVGDALFDARVFAVPSVSEAANSIQWRQADCLRNAITNAAQAELGKKFGRKTAYKLLEGKNSHQRLTLLKEECNINFDTHYPTAFRRGIAAYKIPIIAGDVSRNKWILDREAPIFAQNRNFLINIITMGRDLYRVENLNTET